ncbi:MAG: excalibur calcium-binding domain-containing protein [Burkholderiales bacterium]|nr:excalibur calcium-binding domain-containing protein [Burkholderiales bacterium]
MQMRFEGVLSQWNDARGFGFITPSAGGEALFAHISAFPRMAQRPAIGLRVSFEVETHPDGKKRARQIRLSSHAESGRGLRSIDRQQRQRNGRRRLPVLLLLSGIVLAGWTFQRYSLHAATWSNDDLAAQPPTLLQPAARNASAPLPVAPGYRCDGRQYCSQMTSCAEAKFFLQHCPTVEMDGDNDGLPCERQWCNGPFGN